MPDEWELTWIQDTSMNRSERIGVGREEAVRLARTWMAEKPGSRVYLYRRRGPVCVLVQVWSTDGRSRGPRSDQQPVD